MNIIFQITYNCNLRCEYCYQPKTLHKTLTKTEITEFLEDLFNYIDDKESKIFSVYCLDKANTDSFNLDFFGGECLLYPELIIYVIDEFHRLCEEKNHLDIWEKTKAQIDSNGTLIKEEKVIELLHKYKDKLVFGITFEGTEEFHDRKRKTVDGKGTYKTVKENVEFIGEEYDGNMPPNKLTVDQDTASLFPAVIKALVKLGYRSTKLSYDLTKQISAKDSDAFYQALCKTIDYIVDNNIRFYLSFFGYRFIHEPIYADCGVHGGQICLAPGGVISGCQMFNESFIEENPELVQLGNVKDGITNIEFLEKVRTRWENFKVPKQCKNCPLFRLCENCPAMNYKYNGDINKAFLNCGATVALAKAQLYFHDKVVAKGDYPYYEKTIKHIEETNSYDPDYQYLYLDNYETTFVDLLDKEEAE